MTRYEDRGKRKPRIHQNNKSNVKRNRNTALRMTGSQIKNDRIKKVLNSYSLIYQQEGRDIDRTVSYLKDLLLTRK